MLSYEIDQILKCKSKYNNVKYLNADSYGAYFFEDGDLKDESLKKYDFVYGVINLDEPNGNGTHWVAIVITKEWTAYLDPLGNLTTKYYIVPSALRTFAKDAITIDSLQREKVFYVDKFIGDQLCGVYSIFLLFGLLPMSLISESILKDNMFIIEEYLGLKFSKDIPTKKEAQELVDDAVKKLDIDSVIVSADLFIKDLQKSIVN